MVDGITVTNEPSTLPQSVPNYFTGTVDAQPTTPKFFEEEPDILGGKIAEDRARRYDFALGEESPGEDVLYNSVTSGTEDTDKMRLALEERTRLNMKRANLARRYLTGLPKGEFTTDMLQKVQNLDRREVEKATADPATFYERKFATKVSEVVAGDTVTEEEKQDDLSVKDAIGSYNNILINQGTARKLAEMTGAALEKQSTAGYVGDIAKSLVPFYSWLTMSSNLAQSDGNFNLGAEVKSQIQNAYRLRPDEFLKTQEEIIKNLSESDPSMAHRYATALLGYTSSDQFFDNLNTYLDLTILTPAAVYGTVKGTGKLATKAAKAGVSGSLDAMTNLRLLKAHSKMKALTKNLGGQGVDYNLLITESRKAHEIALDSIRRKAANTGQLNDLNDLLASTQPIINPQSVLAGADNMTAEQAARLEIGLLRTATKTLDELISRPRALARLSPEEVALATTRAERFVERMYAKSTVASRILKIKAGNVDAANTLANVDAVTIHLGTAKGTGYATEKGAKDAGTKLGLAKFDAEQIDGQWYVKFHHYIDESDSTLRAFARPNEKYLDKPSRTWTHGVLSRVRMRDNLIPEQLSEDFKSTQAAINSYFAANREQFVSDFAGLSRQSRKDLDNFMQLERDYRVQDGPLSRKDSVTRGRYSHNVGELNKNFNEAMGRLPTFEETKAYFAWKQWNDVDNSVRNLDLYRDMTRLGVGEHRFRLALPGQDKYVETPAIDGKLMNEFPWERQGDAGIMVWDPANLGEAGTKFRKRFLSPKQKDYINDLIENQGYRVYHLTPWGKKDLSEHLAETGALKKSPGSPTLVDGTPDTPARRRLRQLEQEEQQYLDQALAADNDIERLFFEQMSRNKSFRAEFANKIPESRADKANAIAEYFGGGLKNDPANKEIATVINRRRTNDRPYTDEDFLSPQEIERSNLLNKLRSNQTEGSAGLSSIAGEIPSGVNARFKVAGVNEEELIEAISTNTPPSNITAPVDNTTSPYLFLSEIDGEVSSISTVVVSESASKNLKTLRNKFPGINFLTPKQAGKLMRDQAKEFPVGSTQIQTGDSVYFLSDADRKELAKKGRLDGASGLPTQRVREVIEGPVDPFNPDSATTRYAYFEGSETAVPLKDLYRTGGPLRASNGVELREIPFSEFAEGLDPSAYTDYQTYAITLGGAERAKVRIKIEGDTIRFDNIQSNAASGLAGANTLGTRQMTEILRAMRELFPGTEYFSGLRVSGARTSGAKTSLERAQRSAEAKFKLPAIRRAKQETPTPEAPVASTETTPIIPPKEINLGRFDYILAKPGEHTRSSTLSFQRFPYREGGHAIDEGEWWVRQPQIYSHAEGSTYEGDLNAYSAILEGDARQFADKLEQLRVIMKGDLDNNTNHGEAFYNNYLDGTSKSYKDLKKQFKQHSKDGHLDLDTPFVVTPRDKSTWDFIRHQKTVDGRPLYRNLANHRDSPHNLFHNELNLQFAMERGDQLDSVVRKGTSDNPTFSSQPSGNLSPMATLANSMSQLIRGRYIDDLKIKAAENFAKNYVSVIDDSAENIARDPMNYILNPQWKQGLKGDDLILLNSAKDYRRAVVDFMGIDNTSKEYMQTVQRATADFLKQKLGQEHYEWIDRRLLRSNYINPVRWANNMVFDLFFGFFNVKQLAVQAMTSFHAAAVLGPIRGTQAGFAAHLARWVLYNDNPERLAYLSKVANKALGIKKEHFIEAVESYKRSGFHIIGGETALQDDFIETGIEQSGVQQAREAGRIFFKEGDRFSRGTGYIGAYLEWRAKNPRAKLDPRIEGELLDRADDLNLNMTSASNAAIAKGVGSIPLKFTTYYLRVMEQLLPGWNDVSNIGKAVSSFSTKPLGNKGVSQKLTTADKMRAYAMYSVMFGAPITASGTFGLWPLHKEYSKNLIDKGYETDEVSVQRFFNTGLAELLPALVGVNANFSEALGPSGSTWLYDIYNGRSPIFDIVTGVGGAKIDDTIKEAWPFFYFIANVFRTDDNKYPLSAADLEGFVRSISSVNNAWRAVEMYNLGKYMTVNDTVLDESVSGADTIASLLFGVQPKEIQESFTKFDMLRTEADMKKQARKDILRYHRLQMKSISEGDVEGAMHFGKAMKYIMNKANFNASDMNGLFSDSVTANGDLITLAEKKFNESNKDRQRIWLDKIKGKNE